MKKFIFALLQLFADAGTVVNATTGYVNSSTGAVTNFDAANSLAGELKTFYDTELLENARVEMFYAQFAKKQPLPAGRGKTIEWRKWNTFERASKLQEGVIPTGQKFGMSSKTGTIEQYGTYATVSDQLELHAYDDVILGATEEMGASAAETQEVLIRDALLVNTNVLYCDNITLADGSVASTPTSCAEMEASATVMSMLTPKMVAKAVTKLKKEIDELLKKLTDPDSQPDQQDQEEEEETEAPEEEKEEEAEALKEETAADEKSREAEEAKADAEEADSEDDAGDDAPVNGIRPSFKAAMDEYEAFFDSYVEFMEKYTDADPADSLSMMTDYAKYMQDYTEAMEALEKIKDDEDLSNEELVYYTEVMGRINTKLAKTLQ